MSDSAAVSDTTALLRALGEATRLVAACAGRDLDATLDELAEQARRLFGADDALVHLSVAGTDELLLRRPSRLATPGGPGSRPGARFTPSPFVRAAIEEGRVMFAPDFRVEPLATATVQDTFPGVRAAMAVPVAADGEAVGVLCVMWTHVRQLSQAEAVAAEALAQNAAIAVRTNRLVQQTQEVRAELEGVLDATGDGVSIIHVDGTIIWLNRPLRERLLQRWGRVPATNAEFKELVRSTEPGADPTGSVAEHAIARGGVVSELVVMHDRAGVARRLSVSAAPLRDATGATRAVVQISRDVTDLHATIAERARLDGALLTARRVAHDLNNRLGVITAYGDVLFEHADGEVAEVARAMCESAEQAGAVVRRLLSIVRVAETDLGLGVPVLDLAASS
jgi:PAS domain-containing protein